MECDKNYLSTKKCLFCTCPSYSKQDKFSAHYNAVSGKGHRRLGNYPESDYFLNESKDIENDNQGIKKK